MNYKQPCVYIMASQRNGTLYTEITSDLVQRVWQRDWKLRLIEEHNKTWWDLYVDIV